MDAEEFDREVGYVIKELEAKHIKSLEDKAYQRGYLDAKRKYKGNKKNIFENKIGYVFIG